MPNIVPGFTLPITANATFNPAVRVKMSAGVLALAGASDDDIGILEQRVTANDTAGSVISPLSPFPHMATADGAIAQYAAIYAGASGKVSAAGSKFLGYALEAGVADGDQILIWRAPPSGAVSSASSTSASSFTILSGGSTAKLKLDTNSATGNFTLSLLVPNIAGNVSVTLPAATGTLATLAGTETLTNKTITAPVWGSTITATPGGSTAAAGSTNSDAAGLPAGTSNVYPTTAADDTKGVIIDVADKVTGRTLMIGNGVSNKILKVYPPSGGTINGAAANAAFSSASGKGVIIVCLSSGSNTWLAW